MTSLFTTLIKDLKVSPASDGQIKVTVTLPSDLFLHYARLLESLAGFFQFANRKAKIAQLQSASSLEARAKEAQQNIDLYHARLVKAFDLYSSQGLDRKSAVKQIAADLRAKKHPWCSPDLVRMSLVAAGRGGRPGRPRKQS